MTAWLFIGIGVWAFFVFGLADVLKHFSDNKVKMEDQRTEQKRLDLEIAKVQASIIVTEV